MRICARRDAARALSVVACLLAGLASAGAQDYVSQPGGAGHALLFRDHIVLKKDMKDFPTTALTFEAWISTSDFCHAGTILSYAKDLKSDDEDQRIAAYNHFVIFDPRNLLACHDFKYIDLRPDPQNISCHAAFRRDTKNNVTANYVERDGRWHHLAVTWTAANNGLTRVFLNGLLMSHAETGQTQPLDPNGALVLGGEQDCFAGCVDSKQGFNGLMDEIRIWKVARAPDEILRTMRWGTGLENHKDLTAYWKLNDPDNDSGQFRHHTIAKDSSGKGNDLQLGFVPLHASVTVPPPQGVPGSKLVASSLKFQNAVAINKAASNMPSGSFTVELWAKGINIDRKNFYSTSANLFSYASERPETSAAGDVFRPLFMDDAIRIERLHKELTAVTEGLTPDDLKSLPRSSTVGAVRVSINSNENTDSERARTSIIFDAKWDDNKWHHVAVTWDSGTGHTSCQLDGVPVMAIWKSDSGAYADKTVAQGGVDPVLSKGSMRSPSGSLVLGQDQDCFGGCFSPASAFNGDLALVRVWSRVLSTEEVKAGMMVLQPPTSNGLVSLFTFDAPSITTTANGHVLRDQGPAHNHLELRGNAPLFVYSTAPLTLADGTPVAAPLPGAAGTALVLHDKQVLIHPNFQNFPAKAITVEFWMYSTDTCRPGVPFSYAHGQYEAQDNSFLIFDYNSWGVSVMEDEGTLIDHKSGVSVTDGNWHHVAVTWDSATGRVNLYDNARLAWTATRGKGKTIPSGGTLVVGREQDCEGGCFDSAAGAVGKLDQVNVQEYGAQDFFGAIEEMRIWDVVRTPEQIAKGMAADDGRGPGGFSRPGINRDDPHLVAYWKFDEGQGYLVKDVTDHGHDLVITQEPRWEVVRWLSTCGNGAVEGMEECDDGNLVDGDGCSTACRVEHGFRCTGSPSHCAVPGASKSPTPAPLPSPTPSPEPVPQQTHGIDSGKGSGHSSGIHALPEAPSSSPSRSGTSSWVTVLVVVLSVGLVCGIVYVSRHAIFEAFPQVEVLAGRVSGALGGLVPGSKRGPGYAGLALDPEELDISPDFLAPQPTRAAPGHPGPYAPFDDEDMRQRV